MELCCLIDIFSQTVAIFKFLDNCLLLNLSRKTADFWNYYSKEMKKKLDEENLSVERASRQSCTLPKRSEGEFRDESLRDLR